MRVSCIVPVFNAERFVAESLRTVLDQEHSGELEVLVVDDGSTDGTADVVASFGDALRVFSQVNKGPAAARNLGLAKATGDLIAFQDADDLWMPGKLAHQLARFRARPELEMCVGMVQNFWEAEVDAEAEHFRDHPFARPLPGYHLGNLLARRALFDRVGHFDPDLRTASDNDWFLRARDAGAVSELIPEVLVRRRLHRSNLTRTDLASREQLLRNMKASLDRRRQRSRPD